MSIRLMLRVMSLGETSIVLDGVGDELMTVSICSSSGSHHVRSDGVVVIKSMLRTTV